MKLPDLLTSLNEWLKRSPAYMVLMALAVGLLAGYGAVGFRMLIGFLQSIFWQTDSFGIEAVSAFPAYAIILIPGIGGLVVGTLVRFVSPETRGHGVPEVMEGVALRGGFLRSRVVVAKAFASGVTIASGGSVGREGPIVQIGSAIGSSIAQILKLGSRRMRTLVGCGAAAGVAATFNAPIAGALFAVEVILGDFAVPQFSPIVISSVAATALSREYLGNTPAFEIPHYDLEQPGELVVYVVLGVLAALLAVTFMKALYATEDGFGRMRLPWPLRTCIGGLLVGTIALAYPQVMGVGYESITEALVGSPTVTFLLALIGAKLLAVCITLGSGGSGGVFAPSLFLGALLGALVGCGAGALFPGQVAPPGAYALVGMGAVVAGATHAPITAILILFEMTGDYRIILPLMTSCIIATLLATRLSRESIYTLKLARRGVHIRAGQDIDLLRRVPVVDVIRRDAPVVSPNEPLEELMRKFSEAPGSSIYVVDGENHVRGVVSFSELRRVLQDMDTLRNLLVADDITTPRFPSVSAQDTLDTVLKQLDLGYRDELPVLDNGRLVGVVHMEDVISRYRKEVLRRQ